MSGCASNRGRIPESSTYAQSPQEQRAMTRKDYVLIAAALKPRFDRERFLTACGVQS